MKQLRTFLFASLAMFACGLMMSCDQAGQNTNNNNNTPPADSLKTETPPPAETPKTITMVVSHHVKDYKKWREAFDKDEPNRQNSKMKLLGVFQDNADPKYVSVSLIVTDLAQAKAFASSEQLKNAMKEAGVTDQPEIKFYEIQTMDEAADKASDNRLFVVVKVPNYDDFTKVFASHDSLRKARNVSTVLVARNVDDPTEVAVAHSSTDAAALKSHIDSPEVKEAMKQAGITAQPIFQYATKTKETAAM